MSDISSIEKISLEAHVSLCELRYQNLERRLDLVEKQLTNLQTLLREIHDTVIQLPGQNKQVVNHQIERLQWALIGGLGSVAAWALVKVLS